MAEYFRLVTYKMERKIHTHTQRHTHIHTQTHKQTHTYTAHANIYSTHRHTDTQGNIQTDTYARTETDETDSCIVSQDVAMYYRCLTLGHLVRIYQFRRPLKFHYPVVLRHHSIDFAHCSLCFASPCCYNSCLALWQSTMQHLARRRPLSSFQTAPQRCTGA